MPELLEALRLASRVVVMTGAGASAESGIPTFRDALVGLWSRFDAEALATPEAFARDPELVWGWYEWRRMKALQAQPNPGHLAIAGLAARVPTLTLITQNVDDLHERAGSPSVLHLHGSLHHPRCVGCGRPHTLPPGVPDEPEGGRRLAPPRCAHCGGSVRPGVVWFGEPLDSKALARAEAAAGGCDLFFAIGTSSLVYPAANLPRLALDAGAKLVQINPAVTSLEGAANWSLHGHFGEVLPKLVRGAWGLDPRDPYPWQE
jgi:NAD-dependent deacetylase